MSERMIKRLPMDAGVSGWRALSPRRMPLQPLDRDVTADWLVIGAGFAGLTAARRLKQLRGTETVVLLDAREVAEGPAGRNSGFMIDVPHNLASGNYAASDIAHSREEMQQNRHAIGIALAAAEEYAMPAGSVVRCGKTNAAASARGDQQNQAFAKSLAAYGEPFEWRDAQAMREMTGSTYYQNGLYTPGAVMIQPATYIRCLAEGVARSVAIHENSPVTSLKREGSTWTARTPKGSVQASRVILAVNGHVTEFGHFAGRLMHIIAYASMTRAITSGMPGHGQTGAENWGVLPADAMGATLRKITTPDGARLVIRTRYSYNPGMAVAPSQLAAFVRNHRRSLDARFPQLQGLPFEHSWTGRLCLTRNHAPGFGELEEGLYSACVENGLGTVKSTLAGSLAAELATGTRSEFLDQFSALPKPNRIPPPPLDYIGINATIRLQEWRAGREG